MLALTQNFYFLFGVLTILGGVMGFVKAGSKASLIAGGVSGALILVAGWLLTTGQTQPGLILGLVVSVLLEGRFLPAFLKTKKPMPAGMMALLSGIGVVVSVLAFVIR
ncbi:MAG: TMEM14 family protein [Chthoniobacter sp.]|nr:TMEM14 family protein [Chthoniobacter sp.]